MRVHLRNVVADAIERGITIGFHRANLKSSTPQVDNESERMVNTIIDSVWGCLDNIVDFDDDGDNTEKGHGRSIGFGDKSGLTDAIGSTPTEPNIDECDGDQAAFARRIVRRPRFR